MSISVPFSSEKFEALVIYAGERGEKVEDYMVESLEKWYRKKVDPGVRKYLDAKYEKEFGKPPRPLKTPAPEPEGSANVPSWEN